MNNKQPLLISSHFPDSNSRKFSQFSFNENLNNMNKHKSKASTAFSLIELSIVILIVGIIIAGITQSSRLVRQSKLKSAQNLTTSSPVIGIRSLALWLEPTQDASFSTSLDDEANITQWNDINPQAQAKVYAIPANASSAATTGSGAISYEEQGINGLPTVRFTGGVAATASVLTLASNTFASATATAGVISHNPIVTNADSNAAQAFTSFIVYRLADGAGATAYTALYNGKSNNGWGYQKATAGARTVMLNGTGATVASTTALPTTQEIATITYTGRNSSSIGTGITNLYINGGANFTSTTGNNAVAVSATVVTQPTLNTYIGGSTGTTAGAAPAAVWVGNISEVIIFDTVLKKQDLRDVASYLSKKYNIPLS